MSADIARPLLLLTITNNGLINANGITKTSYKPFDTLFTPTTEVKTPNTPQSPPLMKSPSSSMSDSSNPRTPVKNEVSNEDLKEFVKILPTKHDAQVLKQGISSRSGQCIKSIDMRVNAVLKIISISEFKLMKEEYQKSCNICFVKELAPIMEDSPSSSELDRIKNIKGWGSIDHHTKFAKLLEICCIGEKRGKKVLRYFVIKHHDFENYRCLCCIKKCGCSCVSCDVNGNKCDSLQCQNCNHNHSVELTIADRSLRHCEFK